MHRSCIEECPEDCEQQWETYEEWNSPFEVDNPMTVTCGTNYLVRYICVLTAFLDQCRFTRAMYAKKCVQAL